MEHHFRFIKTIRTLTRQFPILIKLLFYLFTGNMGIYVMWEALKLRKLLTFAFMVWTVLILAPQCQADQISIRLNGQDLALEPEAFIEEGRLLVPLKPCAQALGGTVAWDADSRQAEVMTGSTRIVFTVGSTVYTIDEEPGEMVVAPQIISGTLYVPAGCLAEAMGASLAWDAAAASINIISNGSNLIPGTRASQLMQDAQQAAAGQKTFKFREKRQITVRTAMIYSWGKSYQSNDVSYQYTEGGRRFDHPGKYEHIRFGIPPVAGKEMVEEDNYEKVTTRDHIYVKAPSGVWVRTEEQTPDEFLKAMGQSSEDVEKNLIMLRGQDEVWEGKDCLVLSYNYKPEFFQPLIRSLVEEQLAASETDPATNRSIWEQVARSMKALGSGKCWIDKASGLEIHEESNFTVKFTVSLPVPEAGGHSMQYQYEMQDISQEDRFDYGAAVTIPDVSRAIDADDYARGQNGLLDIL